MRTIYEEHGGFATVRKVVSDFYDRVLDEDSLAGHFESVEMPKLIDHQTKFISFLLGGPASFSEDHIERVHRSLGITLGEFDLTVELLLETLEDHGFTDAEMVAVEGKLRQRESLIVQR